VRKGSGECDGSTLLPPVAAPVARTYHNRDEIVAGKKDLAETSSNAPPARQGSGDGGSILSQVAAPIAARALHNQQQQQQQTMLIRVRSNVGVWKIDGLSEATATVQDVLEAIAIQRPYVVYEMPLSADAACATPLDTGKTLAEQRMRHGSMVHCRVDAETTIDITLPVPPQSTVPVRHASGGDGSILSPVTAPAVRSSTKRPLEDESQENPSKSARANESEDATPSRIEPMQPAKDPLAGTLTGKTSNYVIYMCPIEEAGSNKFTKGLQKCNENCSNDIHMECFQADRTRHVSMWECKLTDIQASKIRFSDRPKLPVVMDVQGWNKWPSGNYLQLGKESTSKLLALLDQLEGLSSPGRRSCNHLSLYRKRGANAAKAKEQFARVREALQGHDWGNIEGASVRIKSVGTDYNECRVLAGM
jgi:hypothetical protein